MTGWMTRRSIIQGSAGGLAVGLGLGRPAFAQQRKLKIALANSYIGNKWRIEMENVFKAALQMEPYKTEIDGTWYNSGNDVSKQSQQLANLIAERVDAILIDAASPTGLNGILGQAAARGILVVSFDNVVTAPTALKVQTSETDFGRDGAEWLVKKLNGKGNVIMVTGVAGTYDDTGRNQAAEAVWAKNPGIKVVARYTGMWDSSAAERNTSAVLPSLPHIDGIWCQGGTDGVLKAFIAANRTPLPVTFGEAENGFRKFMVGYMGQKVDGLSIGEPPYRVGDRARTRATGAEQILSAQQHHGAGSACGQQHGQGRGDGVPGSARQLLRRLYRQWGQGGAQAVRRRRTRRQTLPGTAHRQSPASVSAPAEPNTAAAAAVEGAGISKSFGGVRALDDASFSAAPGEVHALVGENGAGKSTMIKVLGGRARPIAARSGSSSARSCWPARRRGTASAPGRCSRNSRCCRG